MWKEIIENQNDDRYVHTLKEIQQQPECWQKTAEIILENKELDQFLTNALQNENQPIIVSGAGSSEFVGQSILQELSFLLNRRVLNAPTTDIVTSPTKYSIPNVPSLMISFARSGNSPESVKAVQLIKQVSPTTKHLIITCNKDGELAKINDDNTFCILLPKETNDKSLVMTSSFSSMVLAAILCGYLSQKEQGYAQVKQISQYTSTLFQTNINELETLINDSTIERIQFLGTSDAMGLLTEAHLKMLEMTNGQVVTRVDSFLGLRHGPQVFINKHTIVVAILSSDPYIRQYEIDLLKELKQKEQGLAYIIIGSNPKEVLLPRMICYDTNQQSDFFQLLPSIVICQLIGFFKSLSLGLSPDSPSATGTINRVVQGVNIYPYKK